MSALPPTLANSQYSDPLVADSFRRLDQFMRGSVAWTSVPQIESLYTEPLRIAMDQQPIGIICVRVRSFPDLSAPLIAGGVCPFEWDGKSAIVSKIPGLTVGTGTTYRLDFVAVV
jgi:hypothetical protein